MGHISAESIGKYQKRDLDLCCPVVYVAVQGRYQAQKSVEAA